MLPKLKGYTVEEVAAVRVKCDRCPMASELVRTGEAALIWAQEHQDRVHNPLNPHAYRGSPTS